MLSGHAGAQLSMQPERILDAVCRALDVLISAAAPHHGLIPSVLDRRSGSSLTVLPPPIPGQRMDDRSFPGANLMHDITLLGTMYALGVALPRPDFSAAADQYLHRWATHCTETPTGLFPWGEHAFWHLLDDRIGNSYLLRDPGRTVGAIHDHLRQAPVWLWDKLASYSPACVLRFAEGIDYHWKEGEPLEYSRHASIETPARPPRAARSFDFPRHSGFYLLDWTVAYLQSGRSDFLAQIRRALDYWWYKRDPRGLLQAESRSPVHEVNFHDVNHAGQTLSLATSLLECAALLETRQPELAAAMRARAAGYVDGFFAAPHDLKQGIFVATCLRSANAPKSVMPIWGSRYGLASAAYVAVNALCAYRLTGDPRLLTWATAAGARYAAEPLPHDMPVPAMDAGLGVALLTDLYDLTGERRWRDAGLALAGQLVRTFLDTNLPRGAPGIDWYESQLGPAYLLHGLARLSLLALDPTHCPLPPDYTAR